MMNIGDTRVVCILARNWARMKNKLLPIAYKYGVINDFGV